MPNPAFVGGESRVGGEFGSAEQGAEPGEMYHRIGGYDDCAVPGGHHIRGGRDGGLSVALAHRFVAGEQVLAPVRSLQVHGDLEE